MSVMMDQRPPTSPAARAGSRSFSFRSNKSGGSAGRSEKVAESPGEKERRDSIWKAESKANPNAAMTEAQPGGALIMAVIIATQKKPNAETVITEINLLEKTTIEPLRNMQHRDAKGNFIADPDLANPTRPRMERPLDTIRSFERAIESGYKRRSMMRGESYNEQNSSQYASRRSSYVGGEYLNYRRNRSKIGTSLTGYDNGRQSQAGGGYYGSPRRDYDSGPQSYGAQRPGRYGQRMQSDSAVLRNNGVYGPPQPPQHAYHQSHDTIGTNGSDSTGQWANSTDPSSENSSVERMYPGKPYQQASIQEENGYSQNSYGQNGYGPQGAYSSQTTYPEQAQQPPQRRPINLNDMPPPVPKKALPAPPRPMPERRKSRLSRLFGKKD